MPGNIRVQVYLETLDMLESKNYDSIKENSKKVPLGLCFILPCVLWGLDSIYDKQPDGEAWFNVQTLVAFPELINEINTPNGMLQNNKARIRALRRMLKAVTPNRFYCVDISLDYWRVLMYSKSTYVSRNRLYRRVLTEDNYNAKLSIKTYSSAIRAHQVCKFTNENYNDDFKVYIYHEK